MACIFCQIIGKEAKAAVLHEDSELIAFEDIHPQAPVHTLIVPKKHLATLNDINEKDALLVGKMILLASKLAAEKKISEKGYRVVFNCNAEAGQTVFHVHLHVLGGRRLTRPPG